MKLLKSKIIFVFAIVAIMSVVGLSAATAYTHTITLKQGSTGTQVVSLQSTLGGLVADGNFGPLTKASVKVFQLTHSLLVDGIVGPITGAKLSDTVIGSLPSGCAAGNLFSTTTGISCTTIPTLPVGCIVGNLFNTNTGQPCANVSSSTPTAVRSGWVIKHHEEVIPTLAISTKAITGVTVPVTGEIPTATMDDTTEYTATITWNDSPETFVAETVYTAIITITPKSGYTLTGVTADFFTVAGATATNAINTGIVSAVFPETAAIGTQATPTFNPNLGAITLGVTTITITSTGANHIYYTTNGTDPTTGSDTIVSGNTITLASVAHPIKAYAVKTGYADSAIGTSGTYTQAVIGKYWVGGSGSWIDAEHHWASESGGLPNAENLPTKTDNVFIDVNSGLTNGSSISLDSFYDAEPWLWPVCKDLTSTTGVFYTFMGGNGYYLEIYGSITLESSNAFEAGIAITVFGNENHVITMNGADVDTLDINGSGEVFLTQGGGDIGNLYFEDTTHITLQEDLVVNNTINLKYSASMDANGYNVTAGSIWTNMTPTIYMGSGTWEVTGAAWAIQDWGASGAILDAGTSTLKFSTSGNLQFNGGWQSNNIYNNVWFANAGGIVTLVGNNTFNNLKIDAGSTIKFAGKAGTNIQVVATLTAVGSVGNLITLTRYSDINWTLSASSGIISSDYLNLDYSIATGGATFYAGANSTNGGHNTGWIFTGPP